MTRFYFGVSSAKFTKDVTQPPICLFPSNWWSELKHLRQRIAYWNIKEKLNSKSFHFKNVKNKIKMKMNFNFINSKSRTHEK